MNRVVRAGVVGAAVVGGALGVRRARSAAARRSGADGESDLVAPPAPVTSEEARKLVEDVLGLRPQRKSLTIDFAPATVTKWDLLIDGPAFFPRLLEDIGAAKSDVHILIFGMKPGDIAGKFRDVLLRKVEEGLGVRVMVEGSYSQPRFGSRSLYDALTAGGVQVVANQGIGLDLDGLLGQRKIDWRFDDLLHWDHRKVVVIDGRVAYVGGPGIEDHYADARFHDVMLRLEGPIVAQLQSVFLLSWNFQGGPLPATAEELDRFYPAPDPGDGIPMQILLNNPGEHHLPIREAFRDAIASAERRLYVINPYLADRGILRGIVDAALRGADVRVIVPADPHSLPASAAVRHWFLAMREAGVDVREHPQMAHAKVVLSDDTLLAGTANLDALSLRQNWELQLRAHDPALADHVAHELFDHDVVVSAAAVMPSGRKSRIVNAAMSRISPIL
jgi:cardiolipin synthase